MTKRCIKSRPQRAGGRRERGEDVEREQTTVRLPAELLETLKRTAKALGVGFNALVLTILGDRLSHQK